MTPHIADRFSLTNDEDGLQDCRSASWYTLCWNPRPDSNGLLTQQ